LVSTAAASAGKQFAFLAVAINLFLPEEAAERRLPNNPTAGLPFCQMAGLLTVTDC
jgi:hypothetical protein